MDGDGFLLSRGDPGVNPETGLLIIATATATRRDTRGAIVLTFPNCLSCEEEDIMMYLVVGTQMYPFAKYGICNITTLFLQAVSDLRARRRQCFSDSVQPQ